MKIKVSDLKKFGTDGNYITAIGYKMVYFPGGIVGARSPEGGYTELEERAADVREAKRMFVVWANRHIAGLE